MTDLLAARIQMAMSLGFHIIFAVIAIGMPLLMVIAEGMWLRTGDPIYRDLAKRWCKGTAIMFAVGAVSGTVLSFELGLLWPKFMEFAGPVIGMPFSMEGFAFFLEAIFLGIYLYGWDRVPPRAHWISGLFVLISGTASGVFVVCANAWMNTPTGFTVLAGKVVEIDVWAAMFNPAAFSQVLHMTIASFLTTGFAVASIHALLLIRNPGSRFHKLAFGIALWVGGICAILQLVSGDISAKHIAEYQPVKLAAAEGQWEDIVGAPLSIGGWPDEENEVTRYALKIPYALSLLAFGDPQAKVVGLKSTPRELRPPVLVTHLAFQVMVGCGFMMLFVGLLAGFLRFRRLSLIDRRWFLRLVACCGPLGFIAVEAGWIVTEVGRQPWVIHGVMKTKDAVTPMSGLLVPLTTFSVLYLFLSVMVVILLKRHVFLTLDDKREEAS